MTIGYVIGESKPTLISAQTSRPLSIGEYVIIDADDGKLLGLVERSFVSSAALTGVHNFEETVESKEIADINSRDKSFTSKIGILGYLEQLQKGKAIVPATPPLPGTVILEATEQDLGVIFDPKQSEWIRIGSLLRNPSISAKINLNKIVSRHLAILAMTGMGKSNFVSLIAKQISKLDGTLILFDYHNDYADLAIPKINVIDAKINPRLLDSTTLADVLEIRENADVQQRILRLSFTPEVKEAKQFWDNLDENVALVGANPERKDDRHSADRVRDKIDDARHRFADILDPDIMDPIGLIKEGRVNVLNISELSEKQANVALAYYLQELLNDKKIATLAKNAKRKSNKRHRFESPIFVIIEEAHVFIPKGEDTHAKYWASKIAREGRKFGLGLCVVSQRPRSIDSNVLSQMGSLAIMKIVQEDDQQQISSAAESISKDLIGQLTSLNVGDAVLVGQWVNLPSIVHIEEVKGRAIGSDQNAVGEWALHHKLDGIAKESTQELIQKELLMD
ncbi:MAG: ATP-binding protein [Thaumarchaeota archaeon]|nr:ATP-binding protein [Nitrososphaerota archaeon]